MATVFNHFFIIIILKCYSFRSIYQNSLWCRSFTHWFIDNCCLTKIISTFVSLHLLSMIPLANYLSNHELFYFWLIELIATNKFPKLATYLSNLLLLYFGLIELVVFIEKKAFVSFKNYCMHFHLLTATKKESGHWLWWM